MSLQVQAVVIGAGAVGLACARALAREGKEVIIYFSLAGRSPFSRMIYPVPEPGGLGVHLTVQIPV